MSAYVREKVKKIKFVMPVEGAKVNSAQIKEEIVDLFPAVCKFFLGRRIVPSKFIGATTKISSNLSFPNGLDREAKRHLGGTIQFSYVVQIKESHRIIALSPFAYLSFKCVEGGLHHTIKELLNNASIMPCSAVGVAILPSNRLCHDLVLHLTAR